MKSAVTSSVKHDVFAIPHVLVLVLVFLGATFGMNGGQRCEAMEHPEKIDASSGMRWQPRADWVSSPPDEALSSVTTENGLWVFRIRGQHAELPWEMHLAEGEIPVHPRYLVIRYRAEGLSSVAGDYFVNGFEGTPVGRLYAESREIVADGEWHLLVMDLVSLGQLEPIRSLALKVRTGKSYSAELTVDYLQFCNELPADAVLAQVSETPSATPVRVDFVSLAFLKSSPSDTSLANLSTKHSVQVHQDQTTFRVDDPRKGMRWTGALPEPVNLSDMPFLSIRYRVVGNMLDPDAYAIWLGALNGSTWSGATPILRKDLIADGDWHTLNVRVSKKFTATQVTLGLGAADDSVELQLAPLVFSDKPRHQPIGTVYPYDVRAEKWAPGREGFTCVDLSQANATPAPFLMAQIGCDGWFDTPDITVEGIPFRVPDTHAKLLHTGTVEKDSIELLLPSNARELFLLTAVAAPSTELFGIDLQNPKPQPFLSHVEKVVCEVQYESGPSDLIMPISVVNGRYGMRRGIAVHVIHPDVNRTPIRLLLHDKMQTADMSILALTVNTGKNRVPEPRPFTIPTAKPSNFPSPIQSKAEKQSDTVQVSNGALQAFFQTSPGLSWKSLHVTGKPSLLGIASSPLFQITIDGVETDSTQWATTAVELIAGGVQVMMKSPDANFTATVTLQTPQHQNGIAMNLRLNALDGEPRDANVVFPILDGVAIGDVEDTWYYYGRRGGVIHHREADYRDPLGEPHPMQVDGFFGPSVGVALTCMTHDVGRQHHFIRLGKDDRGGRWSIEYPGVRIASDSGWTGTETEFSVHPGDWRASLAAYQKWLATWYKPRRSSQWFRQLFANIGINQHYDQGLTPEQRGNVESVMQRARKWLPRADSLHVYGWNSSKQFGEWGDYSHYEELGGLEHFRNSVDRVQQSGTPVSLYLDAYNLCVTGELAGDQAKQWAVIRPDGQPQWIESHQMFVECPYIKPWQDYLAQTYRRVYEQVGAQAMYIDELGATDGRWYCHGGDEHGHPGQVIPLSGELQVMTAIRNAVGDQVPLYIEYPPSEAARQIVDGAISYYALWGQDQAETAPHFVNLSRFVFPEFKNFHILAYATPRAGNWYHFKIPFFNGEGYRIGEPQLPETETQCLNFLRKVTEIQTNHSEAFASDDVEPLVTTLRPGVYANRFSTKSETVWTLFNTTGRSVRGELLEVSHHQGTVYQNLWNDLPITPTIKDGRAIIGVELPPQSVGCVVAKKAGNAS